MRTFIAALIIAFSMAACDSDSSASKVELSAQQQQQVTENSTATVQTASELSTLKADPGSGDAFTRLSSIFSYTSSLWSTKMSASAGGYSAYGLDSANETFAAALAADCYTESGTTITYNENGIEAAGRAFQAWRRRLSAPLSRVGHSREYEGYGLYAERSEAVTWLGVLGER